jgi:uncharacterized membrane protein YbhN (UPF0104 family)
MSLPPRTRRATAARPIRWTRWGAFAALALGFLAVPPLAQVPARLVTGCANWIALGAALELLSVLGYLLVFTLVFGARMTGRQSLWAGLRAIGASTVLPAGGLIGPAMGVRTAHIGYRQRGLIRSTIAFTMLTSAPSAVVLGVLGLSLWLGWPSGPHSAQLTLPAAGLAWAALAGGWFIGGSARRSGPGGESLRLTRWRNIAVGLRIVHEGADQARRTVAAGDWKLVGALGYYAFDNAVLWAAFRAYGQPPPVSVIVMGYLVGSLGSLLPVPAGIGAVDGGLIGALVLYGVPAAPAAGAVLLYRGLSLSLPVALSAVAWAVALAARLRDRRGRRPRGAGAPGARRAASVPSRVA